MHETIRKAYLSLLPYPLCVCIRDQDREQEYDVERKKERERLFSVRVRLLCNSLEAAIVEFTHSHPLSAT